MSRAVLRIVAILAVLVATAHAGPQDKLAVDLAACDAGRPHECMEAATAMDQMHIEARTGHTARGLRDRGLELFDQRCAEGDGELCFEQGRLLLKKHDARATVQIERACTLRSGEACLYLGNHTPDRTKSSALFDQACTYGAAHACEQLATRDRQRATELHRKACEGDDPAGCTSSGELERAAGDRATAFTDFARACDLGELASCDAAGVLAPEPARARELLGRACEGDVASGCAHLADLIAKGEGGERDWGKGLELAQKGCTLAHDTRCAHVTALRAHPPDWHCSTAADCEKLCAEQIGQSCRALAAFDGEQAFDAYRRGCDAGDATSCLYQGNLGDAPISDVYERGCKLGDADSCLYAKYASGDAAALRRMCSANHEACVLYGLAIAKRDPATAQKLWRAECARKHGPACRYVARQLYIPAHYGTCDCDMHAPTKQEKAEAARQEKLYEESKRFYALGCEAGDARSCQEQDDEGHAAPKRVLTRPAWE